MATAQHLTTEPDGDDDDRGDHAADQNERPAVGIAHPTVVPRNLERDD